MSRPPPLTPTVDKETAARENRAQLAARATTDTVVEYTVANGANSIPHGQGKTPRGHIIVYATATITDTSLSNTTWAFTSSAAGTVKVIWV